MDESLKNRTIKILQDEQNQLDDAFKPQSGGVTAPQKIEKVTVVENSDGTWSKNVEEVESNLYDDDVVGSVEAKIKEEAETLQEFCKEFDDIIVSYNAQINAKKQELVTLSVEAINLNCWPGIAYSTTTSGGITTNTGIGSTTQDFSNSYDVYADREALEIYQNIAGPSVNYGADNPFNPDAIVTLTLSYSGYGYENNRDNGRLLNTDDATEVESDDYDPAKNSFQSSSNLGLGRDNVSTTLADHNGPRNVGAFRAYAGSGDSSRCVEIANEIDTLITEIQTLRSQRESAVSRSNLNTIKDKKSEKELQNWGANNVKSKQQQRTTSNASVISAFNNLT